MIAVIALTATGVVSAVGLLICWPQVITLVLRVLFRNVIWEIRSSDRVLAITFDDGPDPAFTPQILETLRRYNIKATFFLVGERVRRFPELFEQMRDEGHCVGNHSDSWHRTIQLNNDEFESDLLRAEHSIGSCAPPKLFRPAGGLIRTAQIRLLWKLSIQLSLVQHTHSTHTALLLPHTGKVCNLAPDPLSRRSHLFMILFMAQRPSD